MSFNVENCLKIYLKNIRNKWKFNNWAYCCIIKGRMNIQSMDYWTFREWSMFKRVIQNPFQFCYFAAIMKVLFHLCQRPAKQPIWKIWIHCEYHNCEYHSKHKVSIRMHPQLTMTKQGIKRSVNSEDYWCKICWIALDSALQLEHFQALPFIAAWPVSMFLPEDAVSRSPS